MSINESAWSAWLSYRDNKGLPAYKTNRMINKLSKLSKSDQRSCIENCIKKDWDGLHIQEFVSRKNEVSSKLATIKSLNYARDLCQKNGVDIEGLEFMNQKQVCGVINDLKNDQEINNYDPEEPRTQKVNGKIKANKTIGLQFNRYEWWELEQAAKKSKRSVNSIIREGIKREIYSIKEKNMKMVSNTIDTDSAEESHAVIKKEREYQSPFVIISGIGGKAKQTSRSIYQRVKNASIVLTGRI